MKLLSAMSYIYFKFDVYILAEEGMCFGCLSIVPYLYKITSAGLFLLVIFHQVAGVTEICRRTYVYPSACNGEINDFKT